MTPDYCQKYLFTLALDKRPKTNQDERPTLLIPFSSHQKTCITAVLIFFRLFPLIDFRGSICVYNLIISFMVNFIQISYRDFGDLFTGLIDAEMRGYIFT